MQRIAFAFGMLLGLSAPFLAAEDTDTESDAAQPAAIMSDLLAAMHPSSQGVSPGLAHVLFGDLNGDGQTDAVVTYSHGIGHHGGNQYSQRLALFLRGALRWDLVQHFRIGSKGTRFVKPVRIADGDVWFEESFWQAGDPACCPSGQREFAMAFEAGKLK